MAEDTKEEVVKLDTLDKFKHTSEVVIALRDDDFPSKLNTDLADLYEKKMNNEITPEEFATEVEKLQKGASLEDLRTVERAMDDKGYMYGKTEFVETADNGTIVIDEPGKGDEQTHLEEREVPDLSQLILHMRNNPETRAILQEKLDDIKANNPDDARAIELYSKVMEAYDTNKDIDKLNDLIVDENDLRIANDIARIVEYDNAYDVPRIKKEIVVPVPVPTPNRKKKKTITVYEEVEVKTEYRLRSKTSDANQFDIDKIKLQVLLDMEIITKEIFDRAIETPAHAIERLEQELPQLKKRKEEYDAKFADKLLEPQVLASLPPLVLAEQYKQWKAVANNGKSDDKATQAAKERFEKFAAQIDSVVDQYATGIKAPIMMEQYNFDDRTNIGDIYDGYIEMLETRRPDVDAERKGVMKDVQDKLDSDLKMFDEAWGLDGLSSGDADRMLKNQEELSAKIANIEISKEVGAWLNNVTFKDKDGNPEPQFVDKNGKDVLKWEEGCKVKPESKLQAVIDFTKNNTLILHLGDKDKVSDEQLAADFADQLQLSLVAVRNREDFAKGVLENPNDFSEEKLKELKAQITEIDRPFEISDAGFNEYKKVAVVHTMGCINRVGKIVGNESPLLRKLHNPIAKHDELRNHRFDGAGYQKMGVGGWFKTMAWTTGMTLASKGVTYLGAKGAVALGATANAATFATSAGITAMGLSAIGMGVNYARFRKEMKKKGQPYGFGKFLKTEPYATTNLASTLAFTAGACLMTGNPVAAGICGAGAMTVLGVSTFKEARKAGLTKKEAWLEVGKKLSAVGVGAGLGSWLGSQFGMTAPTETREQGPLLKEAQAEYTTHDYSKAEHDWAAMRNDDPRWSEFLQKYHVAPDLQNAADPNLVSSDAMTNLQSAIESAIGDNKMFYSDMGNGNLVANTDMLAYKATQLLYLAPDPNMPMADGTPIGEFLSYTNADGSTINYIDAIREAVSTGKVENLSGFAELLAKVEDSIGGQIGDNLNDMGKIKLFGIHGPADPVQSYNANADAGYSPHTHAGSDAVYGPDKIISTPGEKIWSLGYWEPVRKVTEKLKKGIGALADKLGIKTTKKTIPVQKVIEVEDPVQPVGIVDKFPEKPQKPSAAATLENDLIAKEWMVVTGHFPEDVTKEVIADYRALVAKEFEEATPQERGNSMINYLENRMKKFQDTLEKNKNDYYYNAPFDADANSMEKIKEHHESVIIGKPFDENEHKTPTISKKLRLMAGKLRDKVFKTNLVDKDGQKITGANRTLQHMTEIAGISKTDGANNPSFTASRDTTIAPTRKKKSNRPADNKIQVGGKVEAKPKPSSRYDSDKQKNNEVDPEKIKQEHNKKELSRFERQQRATERATARKAAKKAYRRVQKAGGR